MGVFFMDYFKGPPSELNFVLLRLVGFWPLPTEKKWLQTLYSIYSFLCCFSIISMSFIQLLDLFLLRNDMINLVKNLCASSITFACVGKYVLLFFKIDKIKRLHEKLNDFADNTKNPEDAEIIESGEKQILWMTKCLYGPAVACVIFWMVYPRLESSHERRVPFPYRLPTDFKKSPLYEIVYTYQSMSMLGFLVNVISLDLLFCSFIIRINAQIHVLTRNIKKSLEEHEKHYLDEGNDDNTTKYDSLKKNIIVHQKIFHEINQLKDIFSHSYLIHFSGVIMQLVAIVMEIVVISKGFKLQVVQRMIYGSCGLLDTFLLCYFGTRLEEECTKLGSAIYETNWHEMSPKIRKYLNMIMSRSKRPPLFKISWVFPLNLSTYLEILKLTYNMTALLYHLIKK